MNSKIYQKQLWVVRRENTDEIETGFHSNVAPKLYGRKSDAERVAKKNEKSRLRYIECYSSPRYDPAYRYRDYQGADKAELIRNGRETLLDLIKDLEEGGPWIVSEVHVVLA